MSYHYSLRPSCHDPRISSRLRPVCMFSANVMTIATLTTLAHRYASQHIILANYTVAASSLHTCVPIAYTSCAAVIATERRLVNDLDTVRS